MINLLLDTSTKYLYISLVDDEKIIDEVTIEGLKNHAGMSVYTIDEMLKKNNLTVDSIGAIYCGYGPGSYTGLRISVTIAKMLASFKGTPLYAVSSLYMAGSGYDNKNVSVMFDARRGNFFCANYGEMPIEDKLRTGEEFKNMISSFDDLMLVTENEYKVNPFKVMKHAQLVTEPDGFVPNYLRISEAEYNLEHKND